MPTIPVTPKNLWKRKSWWRRTPAEIVAPIRRALELSPEQMARREERLRALEELPSELRAAGPEMMGRPPPRPVPYPEAPASSPLDILRPLHLPGRIAAELVARRRVGGAVPLGQVARQTVLPEVYGPPRATPFGETFALMTKPGAPPGPWWAYVPAVLLGATAELAGDLTTWAIPASYGARVMPAWARAAGLRAARMAAAEAKAAEGAKVGEEVLDALQSAVRTWTGRVTAATTSAAERRAPEEIFQAGVQAAWRDIYADIAGARRAIESPAVAERVAQRFISRLEWELSPGWRYFGRKLGRGPTVKPPTVGPHVVWGRAGPGMPIAPETTFPAGEPPRSPARMQIQR